MTLSETSHQGEREPNEGAVLTTPLDDSKLCALCGQPFEPLMPWGKYCSPYCRRKTWKIKRRRFVNCVPIGQMKFMNTHVETTDQLVSRTDIATLWKCSPMTVRRLELDPSSGFPQPVKLSPGLTRWRLADIREFIAGRGGRGPLDLEQRPGGADLQTRVV